MNKKQKELKELLLVAADIAEELGDEEGAYSLSRMAGQDFTKRKYLYQLLATKIAAYRMAVDSDNTVNQSRYEDEINDIVKEHLPSGSGIDSGCEVILEQSSADVIHIEVPYHHMDESGMYWGWVHYLVIARASLMYGIDVEVELMDQDIADVAYDDGINLSGTIDYLTDLFYEELRKPVYVK